MAIFYQYNVVSLKNTILSSQLCRNFDEKPSVVTPLCGQKNVNSVKITLYYGQKNKDARFFSIFHKKIIALVQIFC